MTISMILTSYNHPSLFAFFKKNGVQLSADQLKALFNRLNIEKSGGIALRELKRLFDLPKEHDAKAKKTWNYCDNKHLTSSLSLFNHFLNLSSDYKPSKSLLGIDPYHPKRHFTPDFPLNEVMISKAKLEKEMLNPPEYNEINELFGLLIDTEKQLEQLKCELALRADFNIEDAFCLFSPQASSHITEKELSYGLSSLQIAFTQEDIRLLLDKYDLLDEGVISYRDLFDMLIPFSKDYRVMVEMRLPANYSPKYDRVDVFLDVTIYYLRNLLRTIITQEKAIFNLKQRQQPIYRLYIEKIFAVIDSESKGFITSKELGSYLKQHHIILTQKEAELLFIRLDNKRQGKVSKADFIAKFYYYHQPNNN